MRVDVKEVRSDKVIKGLLCGSWKHPTWFRYSKSSFDKFDIEQVSTKTGRVATTNSLGPSGLCCSKSSAVAWPSPASSAVNADLAEAAEGSVDVEGRKFSASELVAVVGGMSRADAMFSILGSASSPRRSWEECHLSPSESRYGTASNAGEADPLPDCCSPLSK